MKYQFTAPPWQYQGPGGWWFVTLPQEISAEIRTHLKEFEEGWGRLKATAQINTFHWETAIWFDTQAQSYLLPLKAEVRKKEAIVLGKTLEVIIWV
ncbi:MAG: DUF1905 domain-containing protein [Bacteroidetes bacterium]|nr:DUF1905 domain-containing protein [Bacteroidota bacterium]